LRAENKRIFTEGDLVIAHTVGVRVPGQPGTTIVDIFRLEHGKIVEHWDLMQQIPEQSLTRTACSDSGPGSAEEPGARNTAHAVRVCGVMV
jgi:hypothetical protein